MKNNDYLNNIIDYIENNDDLLIVNKAAEVVAERSVSDAENMQKEVDELWQLLK